ncbi:ABC transporter ATP-binding protein [Prolixibacteraceae bacterium JC049]|nr:ABC transporter ATP-binding protein [Prolixibacteraceae bacterium JC049]
MYSKIGKRLALSHQGARNFTKGVVFTTLLNIVLMLPAIFVFLFLDDYLKPLLENSTSSLAGIGYYIFLGVTFMVVMWGIALLQYKSNYTKIYDESAIRRISLAEKLRTLPLAFFGEKNLSDLTSTIMEDSTELEHTFSHAVPQLFASVISLTLIGAGLFVYQWQLALSLFWVVPVAGMLIFFSRKLLHKVNQIHYEKKRVVTEHIQEGIELIHEIKAYNQEENYLEELDRDLNIYEKCLIKGELIAGALVNSSQSILKLGMASIIILGAQLLAVNQIDPFTYFMFLIIASSIYLPINDVFNNLAALFYLDIRINRMNEIQALPIQEGERDFVPQNFDITFKNVDFAYEEGRGVLNNVSFTAKQGEVTALVGPSGGGKSTAAKLAARFWDVSSGAICLGGKDIKDVDPETLLKYYSVVFQDVVLFNASIMDNIRVGKRDATDEEVRRVAKLAQCNHFIEQMADGYNTIIGENGATLSGGERQRISIARALLKDAPIVLLDEATASLDVENETRIQAGISELIRNKTVLIIAHRMRTVANANKIVVLVDGAIKEKGTPEQLVHQNGTFAQMVYRQKEKEVEEVC